MIIDTPDLFGITNNSGENNVKKIVNYLKQEVNHVNAVLFVFGGQIDNFAESQKQILKLFTASFGQEVLKNVTIVFPTLQLNVESPAAAKAKTTLITQIFNDFGGKKPPELLPFHIVDCNFGKVKESIKDVTTPEL